jgi:hypothetical protein
MKPHEAADTFTNGNRADAVAEVGKQPSKLAAALFALRVGDMLRSDGGEDAFLDWLRAVERRA